MIIDKMYGSDGEYKKYRSNQEDLQRNQREKEVQSQRDKRASEAANRERTNNQSSPAGA
jgi:hypothetical protein